MKFKTEIEIKPSDIKISHFDKIVLIGSCFTDNIGSKLDFLKFPVLVNPFGIIYNPESVSILLNFCLNREEFSKEDLFFYRNLYHSYFHHSDFSSENSAVTLEKINSSFEKTYNYLKEAKYLFLTFGSARIFKHIKKNITVTNCHKLPQNEFSRSLLSPEIIENSLNQTIKKIQELNPEIQIVYTISPVRHWRDGAFGNNVSKGTLFTAVNNLIENNNQCSYFPSYEIVMDELRDYRFFASDMLHPSDTAVEYIAEKFSDKYFSEDTKIINKKIISLLKQLSHKPFQQNSEEYRNFRNSLYNEIKDFSEKNIQLDFSKELSELKPDIKFTEV